MLDLRSLRAVLGLALALSIAGCGERSGDLDSGVPPADASFDSGTTPTDSGAPIDAGAPLDATMSVDASVPTDATPATDADPATDATAPDADAGACGPAPSPASIGASCTGDGDCPSGYTCQGFAGVIFTQSCQILCGPVRCPCPGGTRCETVGDKGGTWQQCAWLPD